MGKIRTEYDVKSDERGSQLLEVALIITLVVIVCIAGLQLLGVNILGALNWGAATVAGGKSPPAVVTGGDANLYRQERVQYARGFVAPLEKDQPPWPPDEFSLIVDLYTTPAFAEIAIKRFLTAWDRERHNIPLTEDPELEETIELLETIPEGAELVKQARDNHVVIAYADDFLDTRTDTLALYNPKTHTVLISGLFRSSTCSESCPPGAGRVSPQLRAAVLAHELIHASQPVLKCDIKKEYEAYKKEFEIWEALGDGEAEARTLYGSKPPVPGAAPPLLSEIIRFNELASLDDDELAEWVIGVYGGSYGAFPLSLNFDSWLYLDIH